VRALNGAAALLATSVLADSALEHYRGSYENPAMYAPLAVSTLTILGSLHGASDGREHPHRAREAAYATAVATGFIGTGFHLYNIFKRPGGLSWLNLFYAAPPGAPAALSLAGLLGLAAERMRRPPADGRPKLIGLPAGRALAGLSAVGLAGTTAEAGLLHFRGAFHNPLMLLPVTAPPVAALLLAKAAAEGTLRPRSFTRAWLGFTVLLGVAGFGLHAFGVSRAMGGWRNWSQNLVDGPPLPAPPAFSVLALVGLLTLEMLHAPAQD
jgi:hypothetical protein